MASALRTRVWFDRAQWTDCEVKLIMITLTLGLLLFLGTHSISMVAAGWRARQRAQFGDGRWRVLFSLVSLIGIGLTIWGYGQSRSLPVELWTPPSWMRIATVVLNLPALWLVVAAYVPGNRIKHLVGHPMLAGVALWALAHLLSNARPGDVMLFGAFLLWSVLDYSASRRRDHADGIAYPVKSLARDGLALAIGVVGWLAFIQFAHFWLIGVAPLA